LPDAFVCDAVRTPLGRYGGALASVRADDPAAVSLTPVMERNPSVDWTKVDDVILGCANQAGEDNRNVARLAVLLSGLPIDAPGSTVNRLCGSGLDALGLAARSIRAGDYDLTIAGGVENMSRAPFVTPKANAAFSRSNAVYDTMINWRFMNPKLKNARGVVSMPETADNVAADFGVSRADQDALALRSQRRWAAAQATDRFADELATASVPQKKRDPLVLDRDKPPRPDATLEQPAKLKGVNGPDLSMAAGNIWVGVGQGTAMILERV
jgi:acetyl-CoA acyltransferase